MSIESPVSPVTQRAPRKPNKPRVRDYARERDNHNPNKGRSKKKGKPLTEEELSEDPTRCHANSPDGRCALDLGHYRERIHVAPCPHVNENGTEWY